MQSRTSQPVRAPVVALPRLHQIILPTPWEIGAVQIYVIEGDPLTLIDTGVRRPESHTALERVFEGLALDPRQVGRVILTHHHTHHMGQVETLREAGADLEPWVHEDDADDVEQFSMERRRAHRREQRAVPRPRCSRRSLAPPGRADPADPIGRRPRFRGLPAYLATLRRLRGGCYRTILPAHGGILDRPARVIDEALLFYEVRIQRVERTVARLAAERGDASAWEIWQRPFPNLDPDTQMRTRMVMVIGALDVLEDEGRVRPLRRAGDGIAFRPPGA